MSNYYYKNHKSNLIRRWKNIGVISDDFDKLYEEHMKINNCQLCNIDFNSEERMKWRCLDHDHRTGLYRQTICNKCNIGFDRKYPITKTFTGNKLNHQFITISKSERKNKLQISFYYQRNIKGKKIQKQSTSLIKLIAFSFIQELKSIHRRN